jgi:hypothetical protein
MTIDDLIIHDQRRMQEVLEKKVDRLNVFFDRFPDRKELAPEIQNIINKVRKEYRLKDEKIFSKKLYKKLLKFHTVLEQQIENFKDNKIDINEIFKNIDKALAFKNVELRKIPEKEKNLMRQKTASIYGDAEQTPRKQMTYFDIQNMAIGQLNDQENSSDDYSEIKSEISSDLSNISDILLSSEDEDMIINQFKREVAQFPARGDK